MMKMNKLYIYNVLNYTIRGLIILFCVYFYYTGNLTLNRIITFILVFIFILVYSRVTILINNIFINKKVKKYVKDHKDVFLKILYVLLEIHRWINPVIIFLAYTDKCLYRINRYITGTRFINYNFAIYILIKYYVMFGLVKLIIHKYYRLWYNFDQLTLVEILFKRMYGLILSILIFTDILNNIINVLSQYSVWIYILVYYIISTLCIMWELLSFYYNFTIKIKINYNFTSNILINYNFTSNILIILESFIKFWLLLLYIIDKSLQEFTKMNVIIFLRSQHTWIGQTIISILNILVPDTRKETNFKERHLSISFVSKTAFFAAGRIAYYVPLKNRISFKYFDDIGSLMNLMYFEQTFELYWEGYKNHLSYLRFFKLTCEVTHKPSIFLYMQIRLLANLYDVDNQPINRFMDWLYFEIKLKENPNILKDNEKAIVNKNLMFLKKVDDLRSKLMFFIIWDIEYFYNNNNIDYRWNYWNLKFCSILETTIFQLDNEAAVPIKWGINKNQLKFYDPDENMEFLNRLFDVIGIVNIVYTIDNDLKEFFDWPYFVSEKFINYNEKFDEFIEIMYTHEFKRWEENYCECSEFQITEAVIVYKTEDYFQNLRFEWEKSIKTEKLEERNWRLLKSLEDKMQK